MFSPYLASSLQIDADHAAIREKAAGIAAAGGSDAEIAARCFRFVRDEIRHSWDHRESLHNPVTCKASDVLQHNTGYCYAKSHLLAALLRANRIPAGLCYQRLSLSGEGTPYCLHGLNAVWLEGHGWYRIDARGNKPGVAADFCPPQEKLAFPIAESSEANLPGIWAEPHPQIVAVLEHYQDVAAVYAHLPDVAPADWVVPPGQSLTAMSMLVTPPVLSKSVMPAAPLGGHPEACSINIDSGTGFPPTPRGNDI